MAFLQEKCRENEGENRIAALANVAAYDSKATGKLIDSSPHLKHHSLREVYEKFVSQVYGFASTYAAAPKVLDLGAGEGSVTIPFLELGADVTAVDISENQLKNLQVKCQRFRDKLKVRCEDVNECLKSRGEVYDIIVVNSFLHHIPDYLGLIEKATRLLSAHGQFFSFQDPLRYDKIGLFSRMFDKFAYYSWRIFKGDLFGGVKRYLRRRRGLFLEDCREDNVEYHVIRNGVDQEAIARLFLAKGFECNTVSYFSTQSHIFQFVGTLLGIKNTFAIRAVKI